MCSCEQIHHVFEWCKLCNQLLCVLQRIAWHCVELQRCTCARVSFVLNFFIELYIIYYFFFFHLLFLDFFYYLIGAVGWLVCFILPSARRCTASVRAAPSTEGKCHLWSLTTRTTRRTCPTSPTTRTCPACIRTRMTTWTTRTKMRTTTIPYLQVRGAAYSDMGILVKWVDGAQWPFFGTCPPLFIFGIPGGHKQTCTLAGEMSVRLSMQWRRLTTMTNLLD